MPPRTPDAAARSGPATSRARRQPYATGLRQTRRLRQAVLFGPVVQPAGRPAGTDVAGARQPGLEVTMNFSRLRAWWIGLPAAVVIVGGGVGVAIAAAPHDGSIKPHAAHSRSPTGTPQPSPAQSSIGAPVPSPSPTGAQPVPSAVPTRAGPTPSPSPTGAQPVPSAVPTGAGPTPSPSPTGAQPVPSPVPPGARPIASPTPVSKR